MRTRPGADEGGAPCDDAVGAQLGLTPLSVIIDFTEYLPAEHLGPLVTAHRAFTLPCPPVGVAS